MSELVISLSLLARGGGGGSGGGSGGGGAGLVMIGYLPMHYTGNYIRKHEWGQLGNIAGWAVALLYAIVLTALFRGFGFVAGIGAMAGIGAGLYNWFGALKRNKKAESALLKAAQTDPAWDQAALNSYTAEVFQRFQYDWSRGDTASMKSYLTPWYHYHVSLMMLALAQAQRRNAMTNVTILRQNIQHVIDQTGSAQDQFVMGFEATATDQLVDNRDQQVLFTDKSNFVEYWNFQRHDNKWRLGGITQATASLSAANRAVQQFAASQNFCYSLDWGWLLLPRRGQLFGGGKFGTSDINNHVIGMYGNILVQIYTYTPNPTQKATDQYLVAQVQLPKSYGSIVVRRKKAFGRQWFKIRGLQKISTEWLDFNKKYQVFASTAEGSTSFELLHPAFMEVLERQPFEVNLEVVDNVVYFYTKETQLQPGHYPAFLDILTEAFKQMKL